MWSLGEGEATLRTEIEQFRRDADIEIQQISYHIASLNNIEFGDKIQENFLISIQEYSKRDGASSYYLHYLLKEYNLYFIAVLFSMLNTSKTQEFQHRFCMLAQFLCKGCWSFGDQLSFLKLINILLTHSQHLKTLIVSYNDEEKINVFNEKFMIYHNLIQWIQNLVLTDKYKVSQDINNNGNKYHNHSYPNLKRERIFEFINLMILHRGDILYKLISFLDIGRQITTDKGRKQKDDETEVMRVYLAQIYYTHFIESMLPIIVDSPALYVAFIGKIVKFGYNILVKDIIAHFERRKELKERINEIPLINDIHMYITKYLEKVHELLSYLSININQREAIITTTSQRSNRHHIRMNDSEIIFEAKKVLMDLIQFIDYFDDDEVIAHLHSVIPSKSTQETDRLDLKYHRSVCYTNLSSIAMIEQDFENVMEYAMKAVDNNLKNIQSHRYLIAGLMTTLHSYKRNQKDEDDEKHFYPTKNDVQKSLRLMLEIDNNNPFGLEIQHFLNQDISINYRRRLYGRYSVSPKYRANGRCLHSATSISDHELIVFGGMRYHDRKDGMLIYNDIWTLDLLDNHWKLRMPYNGSPNGRFDHSAYLIKDSLLIVIGGKMNRNLHIDDKPIHRLLFGEYEYNLCDIYDIKRNIWYSITHHNGECPPFNYLCDHISICVSNKIFILPIGSKLMYIIDINKINIHKSSIYWQTLSLSVMIPPQSTVMLNNGYIEVISIWRKSIKSPKIMITINPNTLQCFVDNCVSSGPLIHDIEYFAHYTHNVSIANMKYAFMMVHGGVYCDTLRGMTVPQLFDCNGRIYREFVLNVGNKITLIALKKNNNDIMWIGNKIQLNDFIDIPSLYGHRMTNIGGNLVITGGIQNESGIIGYSSTLCFVIPCIDKIIETAINGYNNILSGKYVKATNNKINKNNTKPKQHSNQRFKNKNKKRNKNQKKGKKSKGKKGQKSKQLMRQNNLRQSNMTQNNILKDIIKSSSFETIKINTENVVNGCDGNKWILDISMCQFCYILEIYSSKNKWLKYKNSNGLHWFCSLNCQTQFKHQQQLIEEQLKQYHINHAAE